MLCNLEIGGVKIIDHFNFLWNSRYPRGSDGTKIILIRPEIM